MHEKSALSVFFLLKLFSNRLSWVVVAFDTLDLCVERYHHPNVNIHLLLKCMYKCSTMSPGNLFILDSEGQMSRSRITYRNSAGVGLCALVSAGFFSCFCYHKIMLPMVLEFNHCHQA